MKAIDVANYTPVPTRAQVDCLVNDGYIRAIVGASYGVVARPQLVAFSQCMEIEAYCWITHPLTLAPLDKAIRAYQGLPLRRLWLDAEGDTNGRTPQQVVDDIDGAVRYCQRHADVPLGIYTGSWWWPRTGDTQNTWGLPLWLANYREPSTSPLKPQEVPGGWTLDDVAMWQYAGTVQTCGLNTDRNLILEVDEMAITMAACGDSPTGYRVYALGSGEPQWIEDKPEADELIAAFGAPKGLTWKALVALGAR